MASDVSDVPMANQFKRPVFITEWRCMINGTRVGAYLLLLVAGLLLRPGGGPAKKYAQRDPTHRVERAHILRGDSPQAEVAAEIPGWLVEPGVAPRRIAGVVKAQGRGFPGAKVHLRSELFIASISSSMTCQSASSLSLATSSRRRCLQPSRDSTDTQVLASP